MEFEQLLKRLSRPEAWPDHAPVKVVTTHGAAVFITGEHAYKIKRPVDLGFLDFSTRNKRDRFVREEVRLNHARAPSVYLGVLPVEIDGEVVEHAVRMRRLDDADALAAWLADGRATETDLLAIGRRIAEHHATATRGAHIARFGGARTVGANARENFEQTRSHVPDAVHPAVHARLEALTEAALDNLGACMDARAARGVPCDTHGDLRVDHVYLLPDTAATAGYRIEIIDCIEFNERFRYADPVSDLAFLYMDLAVRGHRALADALLRGWVEVSGDREGLNLLAFYSAYRSVVRAKVAGFLLRDPDIGDAARDRARRSALRHWLFALGELAPPAERPLLLGIGGLPGSGKSALASALPGFTVIRSDRVREQLAVAGHAGEFGAGRYTDARRDAVYAECFERARAALRGGARVIVDASFAAHPWRRGLADVARDLGVPSLLLGCTAPAKTVRERLAARRGDPSQADIAIYEQARTNWDFADFISIDTGVGRAAAVRLALSVLRARGLA